MRLSVRRFVALLLFANLFAPGVPQAASLPDDRPASGLSHDELEAWADETFERALAERRFSGLVISVVENDELVFAKGYGYADVVRQVPVDPDRTRFRIGSITKTFTALAVAQLMDEGDIRRLDDPVNLYLQRTRAPRETTLSQLLTHTAGFGSATFGLGTVEHFDLPFPASAMANFQRPVVRPPGELAVYSNYGFALLGIVLEDVTGQRIGEYFREHIFQPLGMHNTTLNVTPRPGENLAVPYAFFPSGEPQRLPYVGVHPLFASAGAIESTATDMARYMIAQIRAGRGAGPRILSPAGFDRLHRRTAGNHPATSGFGMAFITLDWNGTTFVGHGGDWPGFHSIMLFSPEDRVGFFISCLCEPPRAGILEQVFGSERMQGNPASPVLAPMTNVGVATAFLQRFRGARMPERQSVAGDDLSRFTGRYWHTYRNYDTAEKLLELFGGPASTLVVEEDGEKHLSINGVGGYEEVSPGVFWNPAAEPDISQQFWNSGTWAFALDGDGLARHASPTFAIDPFVRTSRVANPAFALSASLLSVLVCLTGLIAPLWPATRTVPRTARWLPAIVIGAVAGIVGALLEWYPEGESLVSALLKGEPARFLWVVSFSYVVAFAAAAMTISTGLAWRGGYWGPGKRGVARRVHFTFIAVATAGLAIVMASFNMLDPVLP